MAAVKHRAVEFERKARKIETPPLPPSLPGSYFREGGREGDVSPQGSHPFSPSSVSRETGKEPEVVSRETELDIEQPEDLEAFRLSQADDDLVSIARRCGAYLLRVLALWEGARGDVPSPHHEEFTDTLKGAAHLLLRLTRRGLYRRADD